MAPDQAADQGAARSGSADCPAQRGCKPLKREGYVDILEGFAGGLVRPDMFGPADAIIPDRLWAVDDIWLSGMMARKGLGIWGHRVQQMPQEVAGVTAPLQGTTIDGLDRDKANH